MSNASQNISSFRSGPRQFDLIGDIHGHADELENLLGKLGYQQRRGSFRHPAGRRVLFLGDYIDRGPDIRRVLPIVRAMTEEGQALAIAGNHEVNALKFAQRDETGAFLKEHSQWNQQVHAACLEQIAIPHPREWAEWLQWFRELPLYLDLGDLRMVHACWNADAIKQIGPINPLTEQNLLRYGGKNTPENALLGNLINGPEATMPEPHVQKCGDGKHRAEIRIRWWISGQNQTCADLIFPPSRDIPPVPPAVLPATREYGPEELPVFFGHYALKQSTLHPQKNNVACLDYGIGKGGFLAAYRWNGERTLAKTNFIR